MTTTIHYIARTNKITACDMTTAIVTARDEMISIFSRDVNCTGCLAKIQKMVGQGFVPKY